MEATQGGATHIIGDRRSSNVAFAVDNAETNAQ